MADEFLRTLDLDSQAQWDAEQKKRAMAKLLMEKFMGGTQIEQPRTPIMARLSPLAAFAPALGAYFANKNDTEAAAKQADILKRAQEDTSTKLGDFYTKFNGPDSRPQQGPVMQDQPPLPDVGVDKNALLAQALSSANPMLRAAAEAARKNQQERVFKYADVAKDAAPGVAADTIRNNALPQKSLPAPKMPEFGSVPGPNGQPLPTVTNWGRGQIPTASFGPGAAPSATATVQNSPDYKAIIDTRAEELKTKKGSATAAKEILSSNMSAIQALEQGAKAGGLEGFKQGTRKALQGFGVDLPETASTEQLSMALGEQILANARKLAPVTGEDIKRLQEIKGSIGSDPQALTKMLAFTTAAAFKDTHDYNDYLSAQKGSISPMQTPQIQDQLRSLFAGQEIGYEAPSGLFGPQAFQLETARNLVNRGFDAKKLQGLPPEFLQDIAKNPTMQINAMGGFPGVAPKTPPSTVKPPTMSQADWDELQQLRKLLGK